MTAPNMGTIAESLESSFQNRSLTNDNPNQHQRRSNRISDDDSGHGVGRSSTSFHRRYKNNSLNGDATLEINSRVSLPYHWEQCLDLKTGEIYYINWRKGMKAKDDQRTAAESSGDFYYSDEEDDDGDSSYKSEESTSESSPACSSSKQHNDNHRPPAGSDDDDVLVVAGCKCCLMYFMVRKHVEDCPKCNGQLLHFDRSGNGFP